MLILLNVIISLLTWSLVSSADSVCKTPECHRLGMFLKKSMNETANPCTDFYDYVCHNWGTLNPRPESETVWTMERVMEYNVFGQLKKILENTNDTKVEEFEKAKLLHKTCMSLPYSEKLNPNAAKTIMAKVGNWPTFNPKNQELPHNLYWWKIDNEYNKITGESALFDSGLWFEKKEKKIGVIIRRLFSPYGKLKRYLPWTNVQEKEHYKAFLKNIIKNVAPIDSAAFNERIASDLEEVIMFREELRNIIRDAEPNSLKTLTIRNYQRHYDTTGIDWLEKVRAMFKNSMDVNGNKIQDTALISIETTYFEKLAPLLERIPQRIIVNHIHLYFAERHIKFNSEMEAELQQSVSTSAYPSGVVTYAQAREQYCVENNNLKEALGKMYIKHFFSNADKQAVERLVETAQLLLMKQIYNSNWLRTEIKRKLLAKIKNMEVIVGYPKWYNESMKDTERTKYDINPLLADAYFEDIINRLSLSAAYLQFPIYTPSVPYVIDYASTIAMVGHELYHGFDKIAIQNNMKTNPKAWSTAMTLKYENQYLCFESKSKAQKYVSLKKYGISWNPSIPMTTNEDLADMMGLKLAYRGFIKRLEEENGTCPILPGFETFGCKKLFFIAFANNLCGIIPLGHIQRILIMDNHSEPKTRVNSAVANMNEFSAAFGCTNKDIPNNPNTCDLWQERY